MQILSSDLYESSYLYCSGAHLIDIRLDQRSFRRTVIFTFEGNDTLKRLQQKFRLGEAAVNLAEYRRSMIELKRLMFDLIDGRRPQALRMTDAKGGIPMAGARYDE